MRPQILFPLFADVSTLKGVGAAVKSALRKLLAAKSRDESGDTSPTLKDLLFHLPTGLVDRREVCTVGAAPIGTIVTMIVTIEAHQPSPRRGRPYRITCGDETGNLVMVFFNVKGDYLTKSLPVGATRIISGTLEVYDGLRQMPHPDIIAPVEQLQEVAQLEPNYPMTQGLSMKVLRKLIAQALDKLPELPEWLDAEMMRQRNWIGFSATIKRLHRLESAHDLAIESPYRQRLAYDELLANQLALAVIRRRSRKQAGAVIPPHSRLQQQLMEALPYQLTQGQRDVVAEIATDMASGDRMVRLLQGDVGSGKTVVSLLAMLSVIEAGFQAGLMVPTEILGRQHAAMMSRFAEPLGLRVAMLSGRMQAKERQDVLQAVASGDIHIVIGTHALFQESVQFRALGMIVVDEQHRFGVAQRMALSAKGVHPHILLMTATPIPRSLTLTAYGDMDSSQLREKPANRPRIDTRAVPLSRMDEVVSGIKRALSGGAKIYWICPLVEEAQPDMIESFPGDLAAAEERYRVFQAVFGARVALAHGRMKAADRQAEMQRFAGKDADILVATTVVEVGVDVPEATIIVIEHAERFGLAQLHQLRGRVGRGDRPSSCILLYSERCSEIAKKRLKIIRDCDDGFEIAEEDLILRGAGDVLGTRQSGMPDFRFADLALHRELVLAARDDVKLILHRDDELTGERGQALRVLLYLFEHDHSLHYLRAG